MQFSLSPSVEVQEYDFTQVVPSVATSIGAFAAGYNWGPCETIVGVSTEEEYARRFGLPDSKNAANWFCGKNFLDYSNFLKVIRVSDPTFLNSVSDISVVVTNSTLSTNSGVATLTFPKDSAEQVFKYMKVVGLTASAPYLWNGTTTSNVYVTNVVIGSTNAVITLSTIVSETDGTVASVTFKSYATLVKNGADFTSQGSSLSQAGILAKYPGALGNSIRVSFADYSTFGTWQYRDEFTSSTKQITQTISRSWKFTATVTAGSSTIVSVNPTEGQFRIWDGNVNTSTGLKFGSSYAGGTTTVSILSQLNSTSLRLGANVWWSGAQEGDTKEVEFSGSATLVKTYWAGSPTTTTIVEQEGGLNDEVFCIVIDEDGLISGTKGTVLEKYTGLSKSQDAKSSDGSSIFFKDYINNSSSYIWITNNIKNSWGNSLTTIYQTSVNEDLSYSLVGGAADNSLITPRKRINGYSLFEDSETVDVSLVIGGVVDSDLGDYLNDELTGVRRDCVGFISPPLSVVLSSSEVVDGIQKFRDEFNNSTYMVMDTGWKYQYDKYNDTFVWVPLNGDIAGLCANVDGIRAPWWSPAGFNRGYIKNVVKLAYNPTKKADRDSLYQSGINPVVTFASEGTILFGDRTMTTKTSSFQYINVRRLFIMIEKAIATYAKFVLFDFNDSITRAQFINTLNPYLRDIQGKRGIYDFRVVADETVNTPDVIDSAGFVSNILIKPSRSINFIKLNFVSVKSGAKFEEIEL